MRNANHVVLFSLVCFISACGGGGGGSSSNNTTNPTTNITTNTTSNGIVTSTVSGTIVDTQKNPVADATVTAYQTNNHTSVIQKTDANGKYSFTGLTQGSYEIRAEKNGYGFNPDFNNAAGSVGKTDNNALYRVVILLPELSNTNISGANFIALHGSDRNFTLAKTGASISYIQGDDAALQKGVALPNARFIDNQNGTITDTFTGLLWLKNANCFAASNWLDALNAANNLSSGACGLSDNSMAGQWRLPNINELESLVDASQSNPVLPANNPFTNIGNIYWSSTTYRGVITEAWTLRFSDGRYMNDGIFNDKAASLNAVWAVKSGAAGTIKIAKTGQFITFAKGDDGSTQIGAALPSPRFADNGDGTVTDYATGLVWLKNGECINATWSEAINAINNLASGQCGLSDSSVAGNWRMPNRKEMLSLNDRVQGNHSQYFAQTFYKDDNVTIDQAPIFSNFHSNFFYWTSTTDAADTTAAWTLFSCDFGVYDIPKANVGYSMAVRDYSAK